MKQVNPILDGLTQEREGYLMRNPSNGVEITCTEKFLADWKNRGFIVVEKGLIRLMKLGDDE